MSNSTTQATEAPKPVVNIKPTNKSSAQIEDLLIKARIDMLMRSPFFGNLATRLILVDGTDWCPTAATDGKYFYYNRDFVDALNEEEHKWLFGHELFHCVYDHMDPVLRADRIPMLWNIANDYVINWDLEECKLGKRIRKEIVDVCFDRKYAGKNSFEVYDDLYDEMDKNGQIVKVSFDMHLDGEGEGEGEDSDKDSKDGKGKSKGSPVKMSKEEKEAIRQEFKNAVLQAAKAAGSSGTPSGVRKMLDQWLNPQLDWRSLLAMQIQSLVKSNYTFKHASRKGQNEGYWFPGMDRTPTIDIAIALDISGSIGEEMSKDFLTEVHGIMSQFDDFRVSLWCFDTEVHNFKEFTPDNIDELMEYQLPYGGGTDFMCNWHFMKQEGIEPKKFVMFTDGYPFGSWGEESYCDTLFIVHGEKQEKVPESPFGITVKYEAGNK